MRHLHTRVRSLALSPGATRCAAAAAKGVPTHTYTHHTRIYICIGRGRARARPAITVPRPRRPAHGGSAAAAAEAASLSFLLLLLLLLLRARARASGDVLFSRRAARRDGSCCLIYTRARAAFSNPDFGAEKMSSAPGRFDLLPAHIIYAYCSDLPISLCICVCVYYIGGVYTFPDSSDLSLIGEEGGVRARI